MVGSMDLQAMNSSKPEFNWKTVTKGRRTRKSTCRSISSVAKVSNSTSPRRVGDLSGSDSTKFGETVIGQSTFDKAESVPIKKRRHLLQSMSVDTCKPPFRCLEHEYNEAGDFSGIKLLAAAASMDGHMKNVNKEDPAIGDSVMLKKSDTSSSVTQCNLDSGSLDRSPDGVIISKVNRLHWDLNTLMGAWDKPYDDTSAGNSLEDVKHDIHVDGMKRGSSNHLLSYTGGTVDEVPTLAGHSSELNGSCSNVARETSGQATEKEVADKGERVLSYNTHNKTSDQVMETDTILDQSPLINPRWSSDQWISEEKPKPTSGTSAVGHDEVCSTKMSASERTSSDQTLIATQHIIARGVPVHEISGTKIDVPCKYIKDSWKTCDQRGPNIQVGQSVLTSDSRIRDDGTLVPCNETGDFEGHVDPAESVINNESSNLPNEGPRRITLEDSCGGSNAGAQFAEPSFSVGRIGSIAAQPDSDVSQDNNLVSGGYGLTKCQDRYDSPYEDGELRGSFLYSWQDNQLADECVDYESDGRNGDGSDAADYPGSVTVEGASEGSYGTQRSSFVEGLSEDNKSGSVKPCLRIHFVKDNLDNNEVAGKVSNAGSGTTVEQPMELTIKHRDGMMQRRRLTANVNLAYVDECVSKTARGKLHSPFEGQSSLGATDENEAFFVQQSRSQHSIVSPDRHLRRYGPSTHGERDGVHHWASWGSRRQYTSRYHGSKGRGYTGPNGITRVTNKIAGLDFHHRRQTAKYMSEGIHRRLMRKSSEETVDYFGLQRRMLPARGVSNYRTRGHLSQVSRRDFVEDFSPLHDEADIPVHLSRHLSRKDRSFSPDSGRGVHIPLPHQRSQSRSQTRSPRPWYGPGEQIFNTRRHSRSQNSRSEVGMKRMRVPLSKPSFASDFGQGYISPSSGHISPPELYCRWVDDHAFTSNHVRRRRSPVREFRCTQQFNAVASSGRVKSDEHFRPMIHRRNFSFMTKGGRAWGLESNYDDRRHSDSAECMRRGPCPLDKGNVQQLWHNVVDDYGTGDLNDGDDLRVAAPRDAPQTR